MFRLVKKKQTEPVTLREHSERRNRVLLRRRAGGVGDILMQRMMMEDMSQTFDGLRLFFTCPDTYLFFAERNPYVSTVRLAEVIDRDYGIIYDITTACRVHESRLGGRNRTHRSDIWAAFCGCTLTNHRMHLRADDPEATKMLKESLKLRNPEGKPTVLIAPHSQNDLFGTAKSLTNLQIAGLVRHLHSTGHKVISVHNSHIEILSMLGVDQYVNVPSETWLYLTALSDYVVTVDTGTFHMAGGLGKPMVGVFTFTDGKVYGKYYDFILVQKHRDDGWDCGPCFVVTSCPKSDEPRKPCCTELRPKEIVAGFESARRRWPMRGDDDKLDAGLSEELA